MTFRISQFAAACGLGLLTMAGAMSGQAPRYQSPLSVPSAPQPQPIAMPPATAIQPNATVVEDIIVRVNDQIISRSDMERSAQQLAQEIQQNNMPPAEAAEQQKNMLRDMIDKQLMLSRAKELGLSADSEVIRRLDEIRKQNKMETMDDLEKAARQQGVSFEDFKANIRDGILEQQVVRDEVGRHLQTTQGQKQTFYDAHKQEFEQPEQVRLSEILIPVAADAKDDALAQAQAKADDIEAKLKAGQKFEDLAKSSSGGPSAAQGGDLGAPFKRGAMAKVFDDQTFNLAAGGVTTPIRTRQGFVILKVTEHPAAGVPPLKDVEPQIEEAMYMEQLQPALRAYLTKLRESAYIDIKAGFVDSGASAKQTKPVMTAYTPPVAKKKKVAQGKERFDRGGRFSTVPKTTAKGAGTTAVPASAATSAPTTVADATSPAGTDVSSAAPASPAAASSTVTTTKPVKTAVSSKTGKPRKVKREKVRFGQAPRNSLPAAPSDALVDKGLGRTDSIGPGEAVAPGAVMAPTEGTTTFSASSDPDPLGPKAVVTGKIRYSSRAKTEAATKAAAKATKAKEKAIATPVAASSEEKESQAVQAAPLGLNGDTAKKTKKVKVKGEAKERIQQKPKEPAAPAPEATPYRQPAATTPASKPAPSSDSTTLPPVTAPAPGAPPQGDTTPATPGVPIPTPAPN